MQGIYLLIVLCFTHAAVVHSEDVPLERVKREETPLNRVKREDISLERVKREDVPLERVKREEIPLNRVKREDISLERVKREDVPLERVKREEDFITVTTILEPPFTMRARNLSEFEGYIPDLLALVMSRAGLKYEIKLVPDGKYGGVDQSGQWNGMVGELVEKKADMCAAALTMNSIRSQVVDFSPAFMTTGLGILYRKPARAPRDNLWIFAPFSIEAWIILAIVFASCWLALYGLRRCVPKREHDNKVLRESSHCCFALSRLLGISGTKDSVSVAFFLATWRLFSIFTAALYLLSLKDFSNSSAPLTLPFASLDDLADQSEVTVGVIAGGSTMEFFRSSTIAPYERVWSMMENRVPSAFVRKTSEGIERVLRGNYAFITESYMLEYVVQRNCQLMMVGDDFQKNKEFAFAFPQESPYKERISQALLQVREQGMLESLKRKWWYDSGVCGRAPRYYNTPSTRDVPRVSSRGMADLGAILALLVCGTIISLCLAGIEVFWYKTHKKSTDIPIDDKDHLEVPV